MNGRKKIAVITGASSGLGREFVRQLDQDAAREEPLLREKPEELWVIARREDRLRELEKETGLPVRVLPYDLTEKQSILALQELLEDEQPSVRLLINAAGFGKIGATEDMPLEALDGMIDLNCRAAVDMTQICLPYMEKEARILEICSTSAFQPFTYLNVYAATKAFLYRYSRALRIELMPRKISVTAVCPYWVKDTEFIPLAEQGNKADPEEPEIRSFPLATTREDVVRHALTDAALNMPVSTPGIVCTVHRFARKLFPSDILLGIWELIRRI